MTINKEKLIEARDIIASQPDRAIGAFEQDGCFCTVGAVVAAFDDNKGKFDRSVESLPFSTRMDEPQIDETLKHLASSFGVIDPTDIFNINDDPVTTKEYILERFDHAIAKA